MALSDAYVTPEYFQARSSSGVESRNGGRLLEDLLAASRLFDRQVGVHDGGFNSHTATYTFDGIGGATLWLRGLDGRAFFLQSVEAAGIGVDTERDGTFDGYTWDLSDGWLRGLPENASALSVPMTAVELMAGSSSPIRCWPDGVRVSIEGTWGWPAVPDMVKQVVVSMTRELRDHLGAGAFGGQERFGEEMPLSSQTWRLIASAKAEYGRRIPVF